MSANPTIGLCFQNLLADADSVPAGWDNNTVSISGGWLLWGRRDSYEATLDANRDAILAQMSRGLSDLRREILARPGCRVVLNLEANVRLNRLGSLRRNDLARVRRAVALRVECAHEFFQSEDSPNKPLIGVYIGGFALNGLAFGNQVDRVNLDALLEISRPVESAWHNLWRSELGAFEAADFLWQRCYAVRQIDEAGWWKQQHMMNTVLNTARLAARGKPVISGLSWRVYDTVGSRPIDLNTLRQQIEWSKPYDRIEVWGPGHEGSEVTVEQGLDLAVNVGLSQAVSQP